MGSLPGMSIPMETRQKPHSDATILWKPVIFPIVILFDAANPQVQVQT